MKVIISALVLLILPLELFAQVLITEFMCDPQAPLESEWIELYNHSDPPLDLSGWKICDLVACGQIESMQIQPAEYLILCQDTSAFRAHYPECTAPLLSASGWRALNNSGDIIRLVDAAGNTVDSVAYTSGVGDNISWERILLDQPGWQSENWHRSLAQSGSTPGARNSVDGGFPSDFRIVLKNKLFSPGCDCPEQFLSIDLEVPEDCTVTLSVFTVEGRKVKTVLDNPILLSGEILYDGRDSGGQYLDTGLYILLVELTGGCPGSEKLVFGVAKK